MASKTLIRAVLVASALQSTASVSAVAGPIPTLTQAVMRALPDHATNVYWRGYGPGLAFGLAAGAVIGAAIGGPYYGQGPVYYYGAPAPYPYARPVYAAPYAYSGAYVPTVYPGYFAPSGYQYQYDWPSRCYTQEGYGRHRPCSAN